ncbi:MAG: FAD-dependent oxidoreductase [Moraxellaceae bacterium]|nr:FAD-dependent oxidoreductase [Moraxellaceae bacterium]
MKRLVLVGGGHAHLSVLKALAKQRPVGIETILITPKPFQTYSGMLPSWMAGHYTLANIQIDLRPLAKAAGVHLVIDSMLGMDAERCCVGLTDSSHVEYDLLSLDTGSETDVSWLELAGSKLLAIKPLDDFIVAWPRILAEIMRKPDYVLAIVGGGAAGVELAFAANFAIRQLNSSAKVLLVYPEEGLLAAHAISVRQRVEHRLLASGITLIPHRAVGTEKGLLLSNGTTIVVDTIIAASGARPAAWMSLSKLALSTDGYIAVDAFHRSTSHHNVFVAGDACARQDIPVARSGVHAVHAGPVLADNLLAALCGGVFGSYQPRHHSLYLLSCGERYAVASSGRWSCEGRWVWRWKNYIDKSFIKRFSESSLM